MSAIIRGIINSLDYLSFKEARLKSRDAVLDRKNKGISSMNIKGKVVTLRAVELDDLDLLAKWSNSPELWKNLVGWHFPYSKLSTESYIKNIDHGNMENQVFVIEDEDIELIGTLSLIDIDWRNGSATNEIMLGDIGTRGKGYALDVAMTTMRYAFKALRSTRLSGEIIDCNSTSINFTTKTCGARIEGRKAEAIYRNGSYHDQVLIGITHNQYDEFMENNNYWNS